MVKKIPLRTCIACRECMPKKNLMRIVKNSDGNIFVDLTGKANGRGAYLCKNNECIQKCVKKRALNRVFEQNIADDFYNELLTYVEEDENK